MKVDFDEKGSLVITPESMAEKMALAMWSQEHTIQRRPHSAFQEEPAFKSAGLLIKGFYPVSQPPEK